MHQTQLEHWVAGDFLELGWNKFGYVGVPWNYLYQSNQGTLHRRHRRARSGANGGRHDRKATKRLYPDWSERCQGRQSVSEWETALRPRKRDSTARFEHQLLPGRAGQFRWRVLEGDIEEILVYSVALTPRQIKQNVAYLKAKYALP